MDEKAQGSLEYLLILAAILAIAAVVITVMMNLVTPAGHAVHTGGEQVFNAINEIQHVGG
jgi:uncharacterized protein (UPF0333 family)